MSPDELTEPTTSGMSDSDAWSEGNRKRNSAFDGTLPDTAPLSPKDQGRIYAETRAGFQEGIASTKPKPPAPMLPDVPRYGVMKRDGVDADGKEYGFRAAGTQGALPGSFNTSLEARVASQGAMHAAKRSIAYDPNDPAQKHAGFGGGRDSLKTLEGVTPKEPASAAPFERPLSSFSPAGQQAMRQPQGSATSRVVMPEPPQLGAVATSAPATPAPNGGFVPIQDRIIPVVKQFIQDASDGAARREPRTQVASGAPTLPAPPAPSGPSGRETQLRAEAAQANANVKQANANVAKTQADVKKAQEPPPGWGTAPMLPDPIPVGPMSGPASFGTSRMANAPVLPPMPEPAITPMPTPTPINRANQRQAMIPGRGPAPTPSLASLDGYIDFPSLFAAGPKRPTARLA